ncbi:MAG: carboxypeptidase-like regulatory domain-containing protein [Campylobacterota bacterium]|nr:carboxypeptidase-like regulatory domain-containing protein [Campylobacterota bacterium]
MKHIVLLLALSVYLFGALPTGELSLYLLKDGKALSNQEVVIFKKENLAEIGENGTFNKHAEFKSDEDGYFQAILPKGFYQLQLVAKENATPIAYMKKNFTINPNKETQVIVSLKEDNTLAFMDIESAKYDDSIEKEDENLTSKEKGKVLLTLISSEDNKPIKGARVFVKGTNTDLKSNEKGEILVDLNEGEKTFSIIHSSYSTQTIQIEVKAKEQVLQTVQLSPAAMELDEFIVLAPHVEGSIAALIAEKRDESTIADILGSAEMAKKGDSNAAAALKRVAGITLVDGGNIYVRGLGERYSNVEMNSMPLPSPNPVQRVVPLDIFPSSVIGSLKVQKSFSADIPGNFAGGYIDVRTKKDVVEDYVKVSTAIKAHDSSLNGTQGNYYTGGSSDWTGSDDGSRKIPSSVLNPGKVVVGKEPPRFDPYARDENGNKIFTKEQLVDMSKDMANRKYNTHKENVPLGFKGSIEISKKFEIDDKNSIGVLANYSYDQVHASINEEYYKYEINGDGTIDDTPSNSGNIERTTSKIKHGGMFNLSYNYDDLFKIKYTKLYLHNTVERTKVSDGTIGSNNDLQRLYTLEWEERELDTDQITGTFKFDFLTAQTLSFGVENANANMYQPNNLRYDYIDYSGSGKEYQLKTLSAQNMINHNTTLDDNLNSYYLRDLAEVDIFSEEDSIEVGLSITDKTREYRSNKFFLDGVNQSISEEDLLKDPDFIINKYVTESTDSYNDMGLLVKTLFSPSDYYDADLKDNAFYFKTILHPTETFEVGLGVRKVDLKQTLHEYTVDPSTGLVIIEDNSLNVDKWLPNVDLKYLIGDNDQLRFSFSQSFIYPDFREFSSSGYFHPDEIATVVGNPNLVSTDVTSYDVRYEHYYSPTESLSGALFYKNLDNPIEDVSLPTTSLPIYSYANTAQAILIGMELDTYKNMDFIDDDLEFYYLSGNLSYTHSDVTLTDEQTEQFTSNHRTLQGLSPFVMNASVGYDNQEGRTINFSYNYMSKRLRKVGLKNGQQEYPDQYETPPHLVDFVWQERLMDGLDMKFKAKNLIDGEVVWTEGDNVTKRYHIGRYYEVALSYKY